MLYRKGTCPRTLAWRTVILRMLCMKGMSLSSMASKPINIRWIRTDSQPYWKIMYSIVLQTIFHEYLNKNHKIKLLNSVQMHFVKLPLYIWSNLDDNIIIYFRKVFKESVEANWNWLDGQSLLQPKKWKQELFIHNQSSQLFWIFAFYWFYCCIAN